MRRERAAAVSWDERKLLTIGKALAAELESAELGERRRRTMSWEMEERRATRVADSIFSWVF